MKDSNLTINTDASFSPITKKGGYGIWIVYQDNRYKYQGAFRESIEDSTEAELKAVLNAFFYAEKLNVITNRVIVNVDNSHVRRLIDDKVLVVKDKYKELYKKLKEYTNKYELVYSKKIKGHSNPSTSPRNFVNNWCDRVAREERVKLESSLGLGKQLSISYEDRRDS